MEPDFTPELCELPELPKQLQKRPPGRPKGSKNPPRRGRPRTKPKKRRSSPEEVEERRLRNLAREARRGKPGKATMKRVELESQYDERGVFKDINKKIYRPLEIKAQMDRREIFKILIAEGKTFRKAMVISKICPVEAASCLDEMIKDNKEGVTCYLLAEEHLINAMKCLNELMSDNDSKVRLMASAKLADTSYKILTSRTIIERSRTEAQKSLEKIRERNNTWDVEFEPKEEN